MDYKENDIVVWNKPSNWGGKWSQQAIFIKYTGKKSAVIKCNDALKVVRLENIHLEN